MQLQQCLDSGINSAFTCHPWHRNNMVSQTTSTHNQSHIHYTHFPWQASLLWTRANFTDVHTEVPWGDFISILTQPLLLLKWELSPRALLLNALTSAVRVWLDFPTLCAMQHIREDSDQCFQHSYPLHWQNVPARKVENNWQLNAYVPFLPFPRNKCSGRREWCLTVPQFSRI